MAKKRSYEELEQQVSELSKELESSNLRVKALKESESYYRAFFEHGMDGVVVLDPETTRPIDFNDQACRQLGYSRQEFAQLRLPDIEAKETAEETQTQIQKVMKNGFDNFETSQRTKQGEIKHVQVLAQVIDIDGRKVYHCIWRDISDRKKAEEALRQSEKDLKASQRIAHLGSWHLDLVTNRVEWTEELYNMYGFDPTLPPPPYTEHMKLFTPESWGKLSAALARTRETGIPYELELETVRQDGTSGWMWVRGERENDSAGKTIGLWGAAQDITERKWADTDLRESEEKFRLTFDSSPDAININRMNDGLYVDINGGFTKLTGFTLNDVAGRTSSDINIWHNPEDRERLIAMLLEHGFCNNLEAVFRRKEGSLTTALMSARIILLNGEPHIISLTRDISERKRAEEDHKKLQTQLSNAVEIAHLGHWEYDIINDLFTFNDQFYKIFRTTVMEIGGYTMSSADYAKRFIHPDDQSMVAEEIQKAIQTADPNFKGQLEHRMVYADGSTGYISVLFFIEKDADGNTIKTYGVNQDITDRKRIEARLQQAQKMESIGNLAGGIAHDFNNILFPIVGMSEMLMEDLPVDSPEHENAQEILNAGKRGSDLVKQILAFSRQSEHKLIPVRIQQVLRDVLNLTRSTIPSNIEISQDLQTDCGLVLADPIQIHQVAMNLITNAYHAVEPTGGRISVRLRDAVLESDTPKGTSLEPGAYAILTISDTGVGIAHSIITKIFEPYFTTKERGKGTGLGLAVVYGIVKEHNGEIKVYSEVGKGTTFNVYFPLINKYYDPVRTFKTETPKTGNERILLVDDEASIVRLEKQMLERLGYHVTERTSSTDALKAFKANPSAFDLVVSDMTMPNMTGDQLAKELISINPHIAIIICTGFSERINKEKAEAAGIKGFLMKPVVKSEMAQMVRQVLDDAKETNRQ